MSTRAVATFNLGSSSLKFALFGIDAEGWLHHCLIRGAVRDLHGESRVDLSTGEGASALHTAIAGCEGAAQLMRALADWMDREAGEAQIVGAGHRIVHGGLDHTGPALADEALLERLDHFSPLAPAHQPHNLAGVRALMNTWRDVPQTLSFDTAFHRTMPRIASLYALPRALSDAGIVRFGFHGLSYAHIAETASAMFGALPSRMIGLHLGSGASACAMLNGASVATSMGLTALDGLPMATRCGDLDPGVVLHLIQDLGWSGDEISDLLYNRSGLLGVSGISGDMGKLLESAEPNVHEAIDLYCYRIAREVGSLCTALDGLDAIVFSGGVGENAAEVRQRILDHLEWLDVDVDEEANAEGLPIISNPLSGVEVAIIPADEETVIARECAGLVSST